MAKLNNTKYPLLNCTMINIMSLPVIPRQDALVTAAARSIL